MTTLFLSHSSADQDAASNARKRLQELGFAAVFLDVDPEQGLAAGAAMGGRALRRAARRRRGRLPDLRRRRRLAVVLRRARPRPLAGPSALPGPDLGFGPARADRRPARGRPPDVDDGFPRLAEALRRAGLDPDSAFGWDPTRSPYPGLAAFTADDAAVFFGRRREIGTLLDLLSPTLGRAPGRWVSIVGPSGSGKSSLLHAGLLPRLARSPDRWLVVGAADPRDRIPPEAWRRACPPPAPGTTGGSPSMRFSAGWATSTAMRRGGPAVARRRAPGGRGRRARTC